MPARILLGVLATFLGLNGLVMLAAPLPWYDAVPGVTATGAFNPHFVRDIGAAYLVTAGGTGWEAARPVQGWPALVGAAAFLTAHAAIHVFDAACGASPLADVLRDLPGVYAPSIVAAAVATLTRHKGA